jgi:hypothetical protein
MNTTKWLITLYGVLAFGAIITLWRNSSAPDAIKNAGILLASLITVLVSIASYFDSEIREERFSFVLFYDAQLHELTTGNQEFNPYFGHYLDMFTNLSKVSNFFPIGDQFKELMGPKGLDLIEKGVVGTLQSKFFAGWDVIPYKVPGPHGTIVELSPGPESKNKTEISVTKLQEKFNENDILRMPGVLISPLILPPKSILLAGRDQNARMISIANPYSDMTISIRPLMGEVMQHGVWGILSSDPKNENRYYAFQYVVSIKINIKKWKFMPSERVELYERWFKNTADALSKMDWANVNEVVQTWLSREAISKTLSLQSQ